jgi:hypothetical protein
MVAEYSRQGNFGIRGQEQQQHGDEDVSHTHNLSTLWPGDRGRQTGIRAIASAALSGTPANAMMRRTNALCLLKQIVLMIRTRP